MCGCPKIILASVIMEIRVARQQNHTSKYAFYDAANPSSNNSRSEKPQHFLEGLSAVIGGSAASSRLDSG